MIMMMMAFVFGTLPFPCRRWLARSSRTSWFCCSSTKAPRRWPWTTRDWSNFAITCTSGSREWFAYVRWDNASTKSASRSGVLWVANITMEHLPTKPGRDEMMVPWLRSWLIATCSKMLPATAHNISISIYVWCHRCKQCCYCFTGINGICWLKWARSFIGSVMVVPGKNAKGAGICVELKGCGLVWWGRINWVLIAECQWLCRQFGSTFFNWKSNKNVW